MSSNVLVTRAKSMRGTKKPNDDADNAAGLVDLSTVEISSPSDLSRITHLSFRKATGELALSGTALGIELPALWFGVPVAQQPRTSVRGYEERIPLVLILMARELRARNGLTSEGIFRVSSDQNNLEAARKALNGGCAIPVVAARIGDESPNLWAALIKAWFRMLPESLLGALTLAQLADAASMKDSGSSLDRVIELLGERDPTGCAVFCWIVDLLATVAVHEPQNKMSSRNCAIVLAPSLWNAPMNLDPVQGMTAVKHVAVLLTSSVTEALHTRKTGEGVVGNPFAREIV